MTKKKKDLYDKIVSTVLILSLVINQSFYPALVLADETQGDVEQEEVVSPVTDEESQSENNPAEQGEEAGANTSGAESEEEQAEPQAGEPTSQMQTGDADSAALTDTTVNYTETEVPGQINAEDCQVSGEVGCPIDETKIATTSAQTDSLSNSGQNTINQDEGSASLETGDATAASTSDSLVNTNIIEATGSAETETAQEEEEETQTEQDSEEDNNSIVLTNEADHQASSSATSISGQNEASADEVEMDTGDSIASANQVNLINTNIIGSQFEFFIFDIYDENGDINLNELWKKIQLELGSSSIASVFLSPDNKLVILINNQGDVEVETSATAISGQNQAQGQTRSELQTGNSYAAANIFNLVNTNIIGAGFLFGIINIFGDFTGNIIVPSLERFEEGELVFPFSDQSQISTYNQAYVECQAAAGALSGENSQEGFDLTMETGDAISKASCINYLNLNLFLSNWYLLFLNNFGLWEGQVLSWADPQSQQAQDEASGQYSNGQNGNGQVGSDALIAGHSQNGGSHIDIENWAKIIAKANATAVSGQNASQGFLSSLITGTSIALANIFNFINLNIIGGRFFMPIINLFGRWTGNLIFAYPDMAIDISVDKKDVQLGDTVLYTVTYENKGYEDARNVSIELFMPHEEVVPSSPLLVPNGGENSFIFNVGNVKSFESGSFQFYAVVANGHLEAKVEKSAFLAWLKSLVPAASAAENGRTLTTTAKVGTSDAESDTSNNTASTSKYLTLAEQGFEITEAVETEPADQQEDEQVSYGTPVLEVSSSHNVGEYVYPGDVITFEVQVKNQGSGNSKDTVVYQSIFDGGDSPLAVNQFKIGDVKPGLSKKITFGLKIPADVPEGTYNSLIFAEGLSEDRELVYSNDSLTQFDVKSLFGLVKSAQAQEDKEEEVISEKDQVGCQKDYLPYILSLLLAILWFSEMTKRRRLEKELEEALENIKKIGKKSS